MFSAGLAAPIAVISIRREIDAAIPALGLTGWTVPDTLGIATEFVFPAEPIAPIAVVVIRERIDAGPGTTVQPSRRAVIVTACTVLIVALQVGTGLAALG
jgi:hypothetical protein